MKETEQFKVAKNYDEKILILDEITSKSRKIALSNLVASTVAKMIFIINTICISIYLATFVLTFDKAFALQMGIPKFVFALGLINKWNTDSLRLIVFFIIFLLVIPIVCSLVVRLAFIFVKMPAYKPSGETMKEESKQIYEYVKKKYYSLHRCRVSWIVSCFTSIIFGIYTLQANLRLDLLALMDKFGFIVTEYGSINKFVSIKLGVTATEVAIYICLFLSVILYAFVMFLVSQILFLAIRPFTVFNKQLYGSDIKALEDFWLENDPEERKRREEEEARKRAEAEREAARRRAEAEREARKPKLTFHTRGISNANRLTVYVDGRSVKSFDGGIDVTITMETGYHTVQVEVYNDAAETAYTLEPFSQNFEPYGSYDIDYN